MTKLEEAIQEIKAHNDEFEDWKRSATAESKHLMDKVDEKFEELKE